MTMIKDETKINGDLSGLRATQYGQLDKDGHVYLDYTGSGLVSGFQIKAHDDRMRSMLLGNPHSINPTSLAATKLVEDTRARVLEHFNASSEEYAVIFTPNATGAARLVGESYPFGRRSKLVLTADNHNSINGLRQFSGRKKARTEYIPLEPPTLRIDASSVKKALKPRCTGLFAGKSRSLFAYPAQSNFSGVQHPLSWIKLAQSRGYDVLLDAAAYVPTNRLDLSEHHPDYVTVSWYKVFGYPTGVGCLIVRREALQRLHRPWFAGGTVEAVTVGRPWELVLKDEAGFEDGTVNFQAIPDVHVGLDWLAIVGIQNIKRNASTLTQYCLNRLEELRHSNGGRVIRLYGPNEVVDRGATITFSIMDVNGTLVDDRIIGKEAAQANISLRTGCFCNPGAGEAALGITKKMIEKIERSDAQTADEFLRLLDLTSAGVIRVSFGIASNFQDADKVIKFLHGNFRDRVVLNSGLGPRGGC